MLRAFLIKPALITTVVIALVFAIAGAFAAFAPSSRVTLVGSFQSEAGCAADWQPDCKRTDLLPVAGGKFARELVIPEGAHEFKVALDDGWVENYGADGQRDGPNIPLSLAGPARVVFTYDPASNRVAVRPAAGADRESASGLARDSLRGHTDQFYFIVTDRFANGDPGNDTGGLSGDRMVTGFDPTDKGFYHGGDLKGIQQKLDYIAGLGTTAIWLTPSFKNRPVQGAGTSASASYHGYWITDFTRIDPHLGSNDEMSALIEAAHSRGIKVFFDIVVNHTADVIRPAGGDSSYVSKVQQPYKDSSGAVFDDRDYIGKAFPEIDASTAFPRVPTFSAESDRSVKVPAWLNDPRVYHNRGDTTWSGESDTYGDFVGLDDLWTERQDVVDGMTEIYKSWADMGIDGFRVDTVKHVNIEFWQQFTPAVLEHAKQGGKPDFFIFGEVYNTDPTLVARYTKQGKLPATLDFGFQQAARDFALGKGPTALREFFAKDDFYTDEDSNVYAAVTFLGNHDMGRIGLPLSGVDSGDALLRRAQLAHSFMFLTRGQPVVYYGDEQGLIGLGGDKDARQDLFATKVPEYASQPVIAGEPGSRDRYDTSHPLYRHIAELAQLRKNHPTLATGSVQQRLASEAAGLYAVSKVSPTDGREYLVVFNNDTEPQTRSIPAAVSDTVYEVVYGTGPTVRSTATGDVTVTVAGLSTLVLRATEPATAQGQMALTSPAPGQWVSGDVEVTAAWPDKVFGQITFAYRIVGEKGWRLLGTDDNAPHWVTFAADDLPRGSLLEFKAVARDLGGRVSIQTSYATKR